MYKLFLKRFLDILCSVILLVCFSPVICLALIAVYLQDFSHPIFIQKRVGKDLKAFSIFKIRTMKLNSEKLGYSTQGRDPRITTLGNILRKTSIDELPQILNVLLGNMSLVGPRPDVPQQIEQYENKSIWAKRHTIKPGITGLAQVTTRSLGTMSERTALDLDYVDNHSFFIDLKILILTAYKVLKVKSSR